MPNTAGIWNTTLDSTPHPHVTVMGFVFDPHLKKFLALYRSDKVRSAKNSWSVISGLHEIGIPMKDQLAAECHEEFKISHVENVTPLGFYENIAVEDGFHWVISAYLAVGNFAAFENSEPDKHSEVRFLTTDEALALTWTTGLRQFIAEHKQQIDAYAAVV